MYRKMQHVENKSDLNTNTSDKNRIDIIYICIKCILNLNQFTLYNLMVFILFIPNLGCKANIHAFQVSEFVGLVALLLWSPS